mmetsp:Transcript_17601/g.54875  ORF Transcript_17601/g.54875 Transcript_17601/m.54875 type:complete len:275 (+) Transcript_17601:208-1032(+)
MWRRLQRLVVQFHEVGPPEPDEHSTRARRRVVRRPAISRRDDEAHDAAALAGYRRVAQQKELRVRLAHARRRVCEEAVLRPEERLAASRRKFARCFDVDYSAGLVAAALLRRIGRAARVEARLRFPGEPAALVGDVLPAVRVVGAPLVAVLRALARPVDARVRELVQRREVVLRVRPRRGAVGTRAALEHRVAEQAVQHLARAHERVLKREARRRRQRVREDRAGLADVAAAVRRVSPRRVVEPVEVRLVRRFAALVRLAPARRLLLLLRRQLL